MQRGTTRILVGLLAGFMVLSAVAGCGTGAGGGGAAKGTPLTWGMTMEPETLNPLGSVSIQAGMVFRGQLFDTLLNWTDKFEVGPWLATGWKVSDDQKTYTFDLNPTAKWHDGKPLTSEDVKFTIEYVRDNKIAVRLTSVRDVTKVETPDAKTVVITIAQPTAVFLSGLIDLPILPKHIWSTVKPEEAAKYNYNPPIGSGPFKLTKWEKGQHMIFEAVPDYWHGPAKVSGVVARFYPSMETMLLALKQGEIDMIGTEVPVSAVADLKQNQNIKVEVLPNFYFREISINTSDFGKQNPSLREKKVRQALAYGVDKKTLANVIHQGLATPGSTLVHPASGFWHNDKVTPMDFSLEKAGKLLDEAGYTVKDAEGYRKNAAGTKLEYEMLVVKKFPEEVRSAEMIRDSWKQIGVKLKITVADGATIASVNYPKYEQDMFLWGYSGAPDPNFILRVMLTSQIQGAADAGYSNPTYDKLFDEQSRELNKEKRKQIVDEMQRIVYEDSPYIVLYYTPAIAAYRSDRFTGFAAVPGAVSNVGAHLTFLNIAAKK